MQCQNAMPNAMPKCNTNTECQNANEMHNDIMQWENLMLKCNDKMQC